MREVNSSLELSSIYIEEGIRESSAWPVATPTSRGSDDQGKARETCREPLRFYAELYVEHSPPAVWSYFSDLAKWRQWSPICRGCGLNDERGELRLGSVLEISFAVMGITMTVPSPVVQFDPPRSIAWQGEKFGIQATHNYRFIPRNQGTLVCNEETFSGVGFPLNGLMRAWYRASRLSLESLQGIRRELLATTGVRESSPGKNSLIVAPVDLIKT